MTQSTPSDSGEPSLFERLRTVLALVFDVPAQDITAETCLCDLPRWSSLTFIVLMIAIENRFEQQPDRERAWAAIRVGDLLTLIRDSLERPDAAG